MKAVKTSIVRAIKVEANSPNKTVNTADWLRIRDAETNEILHTGQPRYIKRVAEKRYLHKIG